MGKKSCLALLLALCCSVHESQNYQLLKKEVTEQNTANGSKIN